jgi:hypothetical protein
MVKLWQSLEAIPVAAAVAAEWQRWTGKDFPAFKSAFLQAGDKPAASFPCPRDCGCQHRVVHHASGRIVAVCECDPGNCDDIALTHDDVVMWQINRAKFGRAVAKAFDCDAKDAELRIPGTRQVGSFGGAGLPVVLTIQHDRAGFASAVAQLVATLKERFILFAPTSRFFDAHSQALLKGARAGFFDFDSNLELLPTGRLIAVKRAGELFAPFLPEKDETVKQSGFEWAFSVLQRLKSKRAGMKAPLYDVFVHTVQNRLSFREAAEKCECSVGLMATRVREMEKEFRLSLKELQAFGSTVLEMQTAVKGERRRKHKPGSRAGAFADDNPDDDGEDDDDSAPAEEYRYEEGGQDD